MVHSSRLARALLKRRSCTATDGTASLLYPPRARADAGVSSLVRDRNFRVGDSAAGTELGKGDLRFSGF